MCACPYDEGSSIHLGFPCSVYDEGSSIHLSFPCSVYVSCSPALFSAFSQALQLKVACLPQAEEAALQLDSLFPQANSRPSSALYAQ